MGLMSFFDLISCCIDDLSQLLANHAVVLAVGSVGCLKWHGTLLGIHPSLLIVVLCVFTTQHSCSCALAVLRLVPAMNTPQRYANTGKMCSLNSTSHVVLHGFKKAGIKPAGFPVVQVRLSLSNLLGVASITPCPCHPPTPNPTANVYASFVAVHVCGDWIRD